MRKLNTTLWACLFLPLLLSAQVEEATAPYFQQDVDHRIEVALDDVRHELHGSIATTYRNNSPDALDVLWIHLWPNAYQDGTTALAQQQFREGNLFMFWAMQRELGGIDSLDFRIDGAPVPWSFDETHQDIARIALPQPLAPGAACWAFWRASARVTFRRMAAS